jgi:uncharacterized HhH-GPD family protein
MSDLPLRVTNDEEANRLLADDPFALVIGMLLDQQVPMEWAFGAPKTLRARLGGSLDPTAVAAMDPDDLVAAFVAKPALHRYPAAMAKRTHDLAQHLVDEYGGNTAALWESAGTADELFRRIQAMPGYGKDKSRIFLALLGKRFGRAPEGWQELAGPFGDDTPRSVADIVSPETLLDVRAYKQMMKAKGKDREGNAIKTVKQTSTRRVTKAGAGKDDAADVQGNRTSRTSTKRSVKVSGKKAPAKKAPAKKAPAKKASAKKASGATKKRA